VSAFYGGIDPGFTGAIAVLFEDPHREIWDMPVVGAGKHRRIDRGKLRSILVEVQEACFNGEQLVFVVEKVGAMGKADRKEGTSSMFRFGQGQGEVLGVLTGLGIATFEVAAPVWKAQAGLIGADDREVCKRAARFFPRATLFGPRGGPLHGRADALFLAAHARRIVTGRGLGE